MKGALPLLAAGMLLASPAYAHKGHGDPAPWSVCDDIETGGACEFRPASGDLHRGTCQTISGHPVCVRNQPIVPAESGSSTLRWLAAALTIGAGLLVYFGWASRAAR